MSIQLELVTAARAETEQSRELHVKRSIQWLERLESDVAASSDPWEFDSRISAVPSFLPSELLPRLKQLRSQLAAEKDRDLSKSITKLFNGIVDPDQRRALVKNLWEETFGAPPEPKDVRE